MLTGTLEATSNREHWIVDWEVRDENSNELVNLTGAVIVVFVRDQNTKEALVQGSIADGHVHISDVGVFNFVFTPDEMQSLVAGSYDAFVRITLNTITHQILAGTLPVVDGGP